MMGALRGVQDTFLPMISSILAYWLVGISGGYMFAFICNWHGLGLWYGLCLGIGVSVILLIIRFRTLCNARN